jgi:hypothetical protein
MICGMQPLNWLRSSLLKAKCWLGGFWTSYEQDYFDNLLAEFDSSQPKTLEEIEARVEALRQRKPADANAACEMELLLVRAATPEYLDEVLPPLRKRLKDVTGEDPPKAPEQITDEMQKAEARYLIVRLHRFYVLNHRFEAVRQRLIIYMSGFLVVSVVVAAIVGFVNPKFTIITMVIVAGALGGFTSCLQRVYTMTRGDDPIGATEALLASRMTILVSPILGIIFALALYQCFMGGLLSGDIFPALEVHGGSDKSTFRDFFWGTVEAKPAAFAKVLVWSFIAGFAERFVPDLLGSFTAKGEKK